MGLFERIGDAIEWFSEHVGKLLEWAGSDKTQETVKGILELALLVASMVEKFNSPLTGREKSDFVRLMVRLVKYSTPDEIDRLVALLLKLKGSGEMEDLQSMELDMILGPAIGAYLAQSGQDKMEDDGLASIEEY